MRPRPQQSVRELLSLMQARNMINTAVAQMGTTMRPMMQQALAGRRQLSEREQQIVDDAQARIQAVMREQLRWEDFEPQMIRTYQKTFTQKEVDGMKAFYRTPTGQSVIAKMPMSDAAEHAGHAGPHGRHDPQDPADRERHGGAAAGAARIAGRVRAVAVGAADAAVARGRARARLTRR